MHLLPVHTRLATRGDDLASLIADATTLRQGDIVVVSSKVIATVEGAEIDILSLTPSPAAREWSEKTGRTPEFCEAVLQECEARNGAVVGSCPGALLTELRPEGLERGSILTANAGLDQSNIPEGKAIGWPKDPVRSAEMLRRELERAVPWKGSTSKLGVIVTDSCCRPRRLGVTAFALAVSGFLPLEPQEGHVDLFGRALRITTEATADQLATAANFLMGNAGQAIPAVIVREHGIALVDWSGWVPGIEPEEDLFKGIL